MIFSLCSVFSVSCRRTGDRLLPSCEDYMDSELSVRLNGAEAPQYEEAGMEPPANAPLRGPWEVRRILDWDKIEGLAKEDSPWSLLAATASQLRGFNINTAPRTLFSLMPMMTPDAVQRVVERRRQQPIVTDFEFELLTGFSIADAPPTHFIPFPADNLILTLSAKNWPLERRIAIRKRPVVSGSPWVVDYDVEMPRAVRDATEPDPDDLPLSQLYLQVHNTVERPTSWRGRRYWLVSRALCGFRLFRLPPKGEPTSSASCHEGAGVGPLCRGWIPCAYGPGHGADLGVGCHTRT